MDDHERVVDDHDRRERVSRELESSELEDILPDAAAHCKLKDFSTLSQMFDTLPQFKGIIHS